MSNIESAFVTGASGFIGRKLVNSLLASGVRVGVLALPDEPVDGVWDAPVEVVRGNIAEAQSVATGVAGYDTIFHLAAVMGDWSPKALVDEVTIGGTRHVLSAAKVHGCKVVLVSSIVYYGANLRTQVCHEDSPPGKVLGNYSRSKQAQESLARQFIDDGLDVRIVRPGNVYGPGSKLWVDETIVVLKKGDPTLIGGGNLNAGLVYVDHVVDILIRAANTPEARGRAYNACDGSDVTWARYIGDLARLSGAPKPKSLSYFWAKIAASLAEWVWTLGRAPGRPPITHEALNLVAADTQVPNTRAREELGFVPTVTYEEGLKAIAQYLD